jgi:DNA-binding transcriptional ArsR family regulator
MEMLNRTFAALADSTRRDILRRLSHKDFTVNEIAEPYRISLPAISRHLRVLERAGLVIREKDGRIRHCKLIVGPMKEAADWIESYRIFWEGQLDSLEKFLKSEPGKIEGE